MATVSCYVQASPGDVFAVLAEGWFYSGWVVGTSHMRAVQASWPQVGSKLFHASGVWPLVARDVTVVRDMDPDRRLELDAQARPFGTARVVIELAPREGGTQVTMSENPVSGPGKWLHNPAAEAVLRRRNVESLARLTALVERHTHPAD